LARKSAERLDRQGRLPLGVLRRTTVRRRFITYGVQMATIPDAILNGIRVFKAQAATADIPTIEDVF
jgi:hypothetical protein